MRRGDSKDVGVRRPRIASRADVRWSRQDLELVDVGGALAVGGAQTIGAGVPATNDDHALAACGHRRLLEVALLDAIRTGQILHRLKDALEFATWDGQVSPGGSATGEYQRVEFGAQLRDIRADC